MKTLYLTLSLCFGLGCLMAQPPSAQSEFRGVWIATVDNIDWPSKKGLPVDSQKAEYIRLLDMNVRNGMNAVVVQVRPAADAFYPSPYEPWSEWLTGKQGQPPVPYYDPLRFMIEEAHKRGLEFHAWCNPYRAEFSVGHSSISPTHITRLHPDWFVKYGSVRIFDPGNKDAQRYVVNVIRDIVHRYDVDAIHFDDYFYPYRERGLEFQDNASYQKYGNGMNKDDWRRSNVDSIIFMLSKAIKEEKKYCEFGISPFGVWRNKSRDPEGSLTTAGQTNFDDLYADILLWLKNGWIDYVAPQLYWEFGHRAAPYETLADWWSKHTYGRHCYIGLGVYRANSNAAWKDKTQLPRMIELLRKYPTIQGAIYFSDKNFEKNPNGWSDSLHNHYYHDQAFIPPMPWIDSLRPGYPIVQSARVADTSTVQIAVAKPETEKKDIREFRLYACYDSTERFNNFYTAHLVAEDSASDKAVFTVPVPAGACYARYYVTCVDVQNDESKPVPEAVSRLRFKKQEGKAWTPD